MPHDRIETTCFLITTTVRHALFVWYPFYGKHVIFVYRKRYDNEWFFREFLNVHRNFYSWLVAESVKEMIEIVRFFFYICIHVVYGSKKKKKDRVSLKFNRNEEKKNLIYGRYGDVSFFLLSLMNFLIYINMIINNDDVNF